MAFSQLEGETSPGTILTSTHNGSHDVANPGRLQAKPLGLAQDVNPNFPPPKTDKPRPHICTTCTRAFARLEHLKRHERSHTKEKPFACNECTRCFARRDLLLRHQQKLHLTAPPTSKSRRRESTSSTTVSGSTRVRKNSMATNPAGMPSGQMRPRANTISHVDNAAYGMMAVLNSPQPRPGMDMGYSHARVNGLPGVGNHHYRGMSSSSSHQRHPHVLPKLETKNAFVNVNPGLRTAPPHGGLMSHEGILFGQGSTINPAHLHFSNSPQAVGFDSPLSPLHPGFSGLFNGHRPFEGESGVNWVNNFDQQLSFQDENAIENSSPSVVDSESPEAMNEMLLDGNMITSTSAEWQQPPLAQSSFGQGFSFDMSAQHFTDFQANGPLSPKNTHVQMGNTDQYLPTPPPFLPQTPNQTFDSNPFFLADHAIKPDTPSNSSASISSSNRQSSVTSVSTDSISDATRQALINSLSEPIKPGPGFSISSPSQSASKACGSSGSNSFPSTQDLQRYVSAYIRYFHPHLPFLHVATLAFDAPAFTRDISSNEHQLLEKGRLAGGGGSLILAMASIGALYEYEFTTSKDLSEMSKHMIQLYLQERSKMDIQKAAALDPNGTEEGSQNTPLWLVQAMLLNVIYGHNSGNKKAAGIANTQCASLISLARSADLVRPAQTGGNHPHDFQLKQTDLQLNQDDPAAWSGYISHPALELEKEWHLWKLSEERKRTLYAIFIFSSLLVSAYDSAPALMNSEILLDLPCEERLWSADSAESWRSLGGSAITQRDGMSFASAMSFLLNASQRKQHRQQRSSQPFESSMELETHSEGELRPSTFGCLILINALHNYVWETRQHHVGRQWTPHDTEKLHAHMEPALRAWQAAWSSNNDHSLERPNPFGATSMSADCIPLLDLAYVRLFVDIGRSKELFFQRDWDAMAEELATGTEFIQHAEHSLAFSQRNGMKSGSPSNSESASQHAEDSSSTSSGDIAMSQCSARCSQRERRLRKAAYCAANSLMMSDRLNVTFADYSSKELPLQSALCAFDCAQILAEWISTVQQRVGRYVGVLGRDNIDFSQAPACMFLEEDDCKLLEKVKDIINSAEAKLAGSPSMNPAAIMGSANNNELENCGFGSKILALHARMFERDAVWPVFHEMSLALRTQANHVKSKTDLSLSVVS